MKRIIQTLLQAHIILRACFFALFLAAAILPQAANAQTVRYVKQGGTGNGSTWSDAGDLEEMISQSGSGDEIWVFDGKYIPQRPADNVSGITRDKAFVLKAGVKIYGGFNLEVTGTVPAFGSAGRAGKSILSGDLNSSGTVNTGDAFHVVVGADIPDDGATVLDGFTVSGGNAVGGDRTINVNGQSVSSNYGGGIFNRRSSPVLINVTISGNEANLRGGGIYNYYSSPHLTNVIISGNMANDGSGIYNYYSSPVLTNVTISGNGSEGGAIYNYYLSSPVLINTIVWGNTKSVIIFSNGSGSPTYKYSLVQGVTSVDANGNLDGMDITNDPQFVSPEPAASAPTTAGDYRLQAGSPVIEKGDNDLHLAARGYPGPSLTDFTGETDQAGQPRLYGDNIDLGAYEDASFPTAPQDFTATPGNEQVTLEWTAPANDGVNAVTDYDISINGDDWIPVPALKTDTVITGLTNRTPYTFRVRARNSTVPGIATVSIAATPRTIPDAPETFTATPGNEQVTLSWDPPADDGGSAVTGYEIYDGSGWVAVPELKTDTVITGLNNGTQYTFQVRAINAAGEGAATASITATPDVVPDVPQNFDATPGNTQVTLEWTAPADNGGTLITGYELFVDNVTPDWVAVSALKTDTTVTGLNNGTPYTFHFRAVNAAGEGAEADITVTPRTVPGTPTDFTATPGNEQVKLEWTAPADGGSAITSYEISINSDSWVAVPELKTDTVITGLNNGTQYSFQVRAVNVAGKGAETAGIFATPDIVPAVPENFTATPDDEQVTLTWTAPTPNGGTAITGYEISIDGGGWVAVPELKTDTVITGLTNGTPYNFQVRAINAAGEGTATAGIPATPDIVPATPENFTTTPGNEQVTLEWTAPTSNGGTAITAYEISIDGGGWVAVPELKTDTVITGLTNGTQYTFQVRAVNAAGEGAATAGIPATPDIVPAAPENFTAMPDDEQVTLTWTAPTSNGGTAITAYEISIDGGVWVAVPELKTDTIITGLTNGTQYSFQVRAINAAGEGTATAGIPATPDIVPAVPENFTATPDDEQVTLTWTAPTPNGGTAITGYEISIDGGGWVAVPELKTDTVITGLSNSTLYTFRVRAVNAAGEGAEATVTATPESYSIALSPPATYTFPAETYGYDALAPLTVTVTNTGSQPTGPLTATLTGINPGAFALAPATPGASKPPAITLGSIPTGGSSTFILAPDFSLNADAYTASVTVTGANGITAGFNVSFTVGRATPTAAALAFTLSNATYDDRPHPVTVAPATGITGLGAITVLYNGSTTVPVYPGTYTVTIDIAEGDNYTAVTGLPAGTFSIYEPTTPVIRRLVTLRSAPGLTTDPSAGSYYIDSGTNFTFRLTPDVPLPDGVLPQVQTDRAGAPDGSSGIRITPNADGSYTVVIFAIRQNIEITLSTATDNAFVAAGALKVFTTPSALVIANSRPDAATVYVYNLAGMLVRRTTIPPGTTRLSVAPGIYIITDGGAFRQKAAVVR